MNQEREERKQRLKRERPDDRPTQQRAYPSMNDNPFHVKNQRTYDKSRLPPGKLEFLRITFASLHGSTSIYYKIF